MGKYSKALYIGLIMVLLPMLFSGCAVGAAVFQSEQENSTESEEEPVFELMEVEISLGETVEAGDFVSYCEYGGSIDFYFVQEPDYTVLEEQTIIVAAEDSSGNVSEKETILTIVDDEAPVISGVVDKTYTVGDNVSYLSDVTAEDDYDGEVEITVDRSEVDTDTEGSYTVWYYATDSSGNTASESATFTFITEDEAELNLQLDEMCETIFAEIMEDDMSIGEQAYAIFCYVSDHISYTGTSDKSDWKTEAYNGYLTGSGDCFTYYSLSRALLEYLGVEVLPVERVGGYSSHYWLLVNLGTGWYHFDPCAKPSDYPFECFMKTDAEIAAYSDEVEEGQPGRNYYVYDYDSFPDTPDESYSY